MKGFFASTYAIFSFKRRDIVFCYNRIKKRSKHPFSSKMKQSRKILAGPYFQGLRFFDAFLNKEILRP